MLTSRRDIHEGSLFRSFLGIALENGAETTSCFFSSFTSRISFRYPGCGYIKSVFVVIWGVDILKVYSSLSGVYIYSKCALFFVAFRRSINARQ